MPDDKPPTALTPQPDPRFILQSKKMDLEARQKDRELGWVGRVIGTPPNATTNLALVIIVSVLVAGVVISFALPNDRLEFWKVIILPILTLTLGYVLGKKDGS